MVENMRTKKKWQVTDKNNGWLRMLVPGKSDEIQSAHKNTGNDIVQNVRTKKKWRAIVYI